MKSGLTSTPHDAIQRSGNANVRSWFIKEYDMAKSHSQLLQHRVLLITKHIASARMTHEAHQNTDMLVNNDNTSLQMVRTAIHSTR